MIVVGAKGMAKELVEVLSHEMKLIDEEILFFDNVTTSMPSHLYGRFKVLKDFDEVAAYFKAHSPKFSLGIGNPQFRKLMADKFIQLGGTLTSAISHKSHIGAFGTTIGVGAIIMQGVIITNDVTLGKGVLVNINSSISHDSTIGNFVEIACGVVIPGNCVIEDCVFIGSNAVLIPNVTIGANAIIGAGAVVINDVPENVTVVGNPAKIVKHHVFRRR